MVSQPRRGERIKNCSYNEKSIYNHSMCAQSLLCKIPTSFEQIKNRLTANKQ